jgi:hypothetical protein
LAILAYWKINNLRGINADLENKSTPRNQPFQKSTIFDVCTLCGQTRLALANCHAGGTANPVPVQWDAWVRRGNRCFLSLPSASLPLAGDKRFRSIPGWQRHLTLLSIEWDSAVSTFDDVFADDKGQKTHPHIGAWPILIAASAPAPSAETVEIRADRNFGEGQAAKTKR